jgi:hypothetical protein
MSSGPIKDSALIDPSSTSFNDLLPDVGKLFPLSKNMLSHIKFNKAVQKLVGYIQQIPEVQKLRISLDLVKRIADIIENLGFKKKSINKKELLITAFQLVFKLNTAEVIIISDFIEFIWSNKLIKKLSFVKRNYVFIKKKLLKTLLK